MYILGINAYHGDSSACLVKNGRLIAALEEERVRRIKHWAGFPSEAIKFCLEHAGINIGDVDHIAVGRDPKAHLWQRALFVLKNRPSPVFLWDRLKNQARVRSFDDEIRRTFNLKEGALKARIHHVEHHQAHFASGFFVSPFDKAAILSVDGLGDFVSTMFGVGEGNTIKIFEETFFPHSLGFFYTALTQYLGFWKYGDEYKVMGLSAFGKPEFLNTMRDIVKTKNDGSFELNLNYFIHQKGEVSMTWDGGEPVISKMFSKKLEEILGPAREKDKPLEKHHEDIAASIQARYEEVFFYLLGKLAQKTGSENLCLVGGCAQNSLANGKIYANSSFENVYIPPAGHDAGIAIGAAFHVWNQILGNERKFVMSSPFWGPEYDEEYIKSKIVNLKNDRELRVERLEKSDLIQKTARLIADGNIVGWFQGRTEWGPRALGNRSILANPCRKDMKEILNLKIKKREPFRPFAPSVLEEVVGEYFQETHPVPFMEKVYMIKPEKRDVIPAITHADGTGRLQTVSKESNPLYYKLIKAFGDITGVPIVLNTSFNENEPIVNRPEEAVDCFLRTKMDVLVLGNYIILRNTK